MITRQRPGVEHVERPHAVGSHLPNQGDGGSGPLPRQFLSHARSVVITPGARSHMAPVVSTCPPAAPGVINL